MNARDTVGYTPLHYAVRAFSPDSALVRILLDAGADLAVTGEDGQTPLRRAVEWADAGTVRLLLDAGVDPNSRDGEGSTPLHGAAERGQDQIAGALLEAGADVNATDGQGATPLHLAAGEPQDAGRVIRVLTEAGANLGATDKEGETPVHRAVSRKRPDALLALFEAGGDPDLRYPDGEPLLHRIVQMSVFDPRLALFEALVAAGVDLEAGDQVGDTALYAVLSWAAWAERDPLLFDALLGAGADPQRPLQPGGRYSPEPFGVTGPARDRGEALGRRG